jgi:hypothetical protein
MSAEKPFSYSAILAKSMGKPSVSPPPTSVSPSLPNASNTSTQQSNHSSPTSEHPTATTAPSPRRPIRLSNQQQQQQHGGNRNRSHGSNTTSNTASSASNSSTSAATSLSQSAPQNATVSQTASSATPSSSSASTSTPASSASMNTSSSPARSASPQTTSDAPVVSAWTRPLPSLLKTGNSSTMTSTTSTTQSSPTPQSQASRKSGRSSPPITTATSSSSRPSPSTTTSSSSTTNAAAAKPASSPVESHSHTTTITTENATSSLAPSNVKPLSYLAAVDPAQASRVGASSPSSTSPPPPSAQKSVDTNGTSAVRSASPSTSTPSQEENSGSLSRGSVDSSYSANEPNSSNAAAKKKKKKSKKKFNESDFKNYDEVSDETTDTTQKDQDVQPSNGNPPVTHPPYTTSPVQSTTPRFGNTRQHHSTNAYSHDQQQYSQPMDPYMQDTRSNQYYNQHQPPHAYVHGTHMMGSPNNSYRTNRRGGSHSNQRPTVPYHTNVHQQHDRNNGLRMNVAANPTGNMHLQNPRGGHRGGGMQYRRGRGGFYYNNVWSYMGAGDEMIPNDSTNEGLYGTDSNIPLVPMTQYLQMNMGGYNPSNMMPLQMSGPMHPTGSPVINPANPNTSIGAPVPSISSPSRKDDLRRQIEYYFSVENLAKDSYLRGLMSPRGYVVLENLLSFRRIQQLTQSVDELTSAARSSTYLKVKNRSVRIRTDWQTWVYPKPTDNEESSEEEVGKEDESSVYDSPSNEMLSNPMPSSMNPYPYYIYPQYIPYPYQNNMMGMGVNMLHDQQYILPHSQQSYQQSSPMDGKKYSQQRKRQSMNHRNPHSVTSPQFSHRRDPHSTTTSMSASPSTSVAAPEASESNQQSASTESQTQDQSSQQVSSIESSS